MAIDIIFSDSGVNSVIGYINNINKIDEARRQHGVDTEARAALQTERLESVERVAAGRNEVDKYITDSTNAVAERESQRRFDLGMEAVNIEKDTIAYAKAKERVGRLQTSYDDLSEKAVLEEQKAVQYLRDQGHEINASDKTTWGPQVHKLVHDRVEVQTPGLNRAVQKFYNDAGSFTFATGTPTDGQPPAGNVAGADPASVAAHDTPVGAVITHTDPNGNQVPVTQGGDSIEAGDAPILMTNTQLLEQAGMTADYGLTVAPVFRLDDKAETQELREKVQAEQKEAQARVRAGESRDAVRSDIEGRSGSSADFISRSMGVGVTPEEWTNNFNAERLANKRKREAANAGQDAETAAKLTQDDQEWQNMADAEQSVTYERGIQRLAANPNPLDLSDYKSHAQQTPLQPDLSAANGRQPSQFTTPFAEEDVGRISGYNELNSLAGLQNNDASTAAGHVFSADPVTREQEKITRQAAAVRAERERVGVTDPGTGERRQHVPTTNRTYATQTFAPTAQRMINAGYYTSGSNAQDTQIDIEDALRDQGVDPRDPAALSDWVTYQFKVNPQAYTEGVPGVEGKNWSQLTERQQQHISQQMVMTLTDRHVQSKGGIRRAWEGTGRGIRNTFTDRSNRSLPLTSDVAPGANRSIAARGEENVTGGEAGASVTTPIPDDDELIQGIRRQPLYPR